MPSGNAQHVINWLLGSSKGQDITPQEGADGDNGLAAWVQKTFGVQPTKQTPDGKSPYDGPDDVAGETFEAKWLADPNAKGDKKGAIAALRQGRAGEGNDASANYVDGKAEGTGKAMADTMTVPEHIIDGVKD